MSTFDGLPDIFADAFGEPVTYQGRSIVAIWIDPALVASMPFGVGVVTSRTELHVRAADFEVPPTEGDAPIVRLKDGSTWRVDGPPQPDGKGMIALTLGR